MHLPAGGVGNKTTGFDLQNRRINAHCSGTFKNVNAFFFAKMPFALTGHFDSFGSCLELFSCHHVVSSWKSPDQFNMFKGFQCTAGSAPPMPT
jgi:hypothetical protein